MQLACGELVGTRVNSKIPGYVLKDIHDTRSLGPHDVIVQ